MNRLFDRIFPEYKRLPANIRALYWITLLGELYLITPIWMFFYLRYLTFEQIALITIIQQLTTIIFEVPTGAFADIFGKRKTLIISTFLYSVSLFLTPFGATFTFFSSVEMLKGIAKALYSGAFEALTYDSLKENDSEDLFPAVSANFITVSWIGYIFAGVLGGVLYDIWFSLPYLTLSLFYMIAALLLVKFVKEPNIVTVKATASNYIKQNTEGFKELFSHIHISLITITLALITLGYYTASELLGISQGRQYGFSGTHVGLIFTVGYIVSVLLSNIFPVLLKKYKTTAIIVSTTSALLVSFLLAKYVNPILGASLIVLRISSSSTFSNVKSVILNRNISSKNRSTALSSFALLYELGYVAIAYFAGNYIGRNSPNDFAFILGAVLLGSLLCVAIARFYFRSRIQNYNAH